MYCVRCRQSTETNDIEYLISKNGRNMKRGKCAVCGSVKTQFVKSNAAALANEVMPAALTSKASSGGDLVNSLNSITSKFKLPGQKFKGEMHLPGHNFTGPGTRLDLRLNPDNTPKEWSMPVDRVDDAAYRHDLSYSKYSDTANRNVADQIMINELNSIQNPTLKERAEMAIVKPIIKSKQLFGLGMKQSFLEKGRRRRVKR